MESIVTNPVNSKPLFVIDFQGERISNMFYEDSLSVKHDLSRFLDEKMEAGFCSQSEWDLFSANYQQEYGYVPKLYGDDIKIVADTNSLGTMEFDNPNGFHAIISIEQGPKAKFYMLTVYQEGKEFPVLTKSYPTLRGCKISMGRQFPGWVWPESEVA